MGILRNRPNPVRPLQRSHHRRLRRILLRSHLATSNRRPRASRRPMRSSRRSRSGKPRRNAKRKLAQPTSNLLLNSRANATDHRCAR
jgi:hypothetical protein